MNSRIKELEPGLRVPENNIIERNFSKIFFWTKKITAESKNKNSQFIPENPKPERSLLQRRLRRDLLTTFRGIPKENKQARKTILQEAKEKDRIAAEYLQQFELTVNLDSLGEQQARFTVLEPPKEKAEQRNLPPVFLIPGLSNDIDPVGALAQELAFSGRKVIVIGYPEASLGRVSEAFAQTISENPRFGPHAAFFKQAIQEVAAHQGLHTYEVWSHSTGGPILAEILKDKSMQETVENAIFVSPAAAKEQSMVEFGKGLLKEIGIVLKQYEFLSKYSLVPPGLGGDTEQNKLKQKVNSALIKAILAEYPNWDTVSAGEGSKTVFWSGRKDFVTKTADSFLLGAGEHQDLIENPEGTHLTALVKPEIVISEIDTKMGR